MTATYEHKPPKGPLQRVVEHMSIETAKLDKEGGYSIPEFEPAEFVSLTAGMNDRIGRELCGVMAEHSQAVNRTVQELHLWAWLQWLHDWPERSITPKLVGLLAFAAVADYQLGNPGYTRDEIARFLKIKPQEFLRLVPCWSSMRSRLLEGEGAMVRHIMDQMREDERNAA